MQEARSHLLKNGMSQQFTDLLAARYIQRLEDKEAAHISKIMDFFDTKRVGFEAMQALGDAKMEDVCMNYQMLSNYNQELYQNEVRRTLATHQKQRHQH